MPMVMMVNSSDFGHARDERADGQRRFGLPHENAGRHVQRFRPAGPHHLLHHDRHAAHDPLHDAQVIKDRQKNEAMKITMGSTWKANTTPNGPVFTPSGRRRTGCRLGELSIALTPTPMV